jgi:fatty acid desaturase
VPLSDAERATLEQLERELDLDLDQLRPDRADALRKSVLGATVVFLVALSAYSVLVGSAVPALMAVPIAGAVLLSLRLALRAPGPVAAGRPQEPPH